MIKRLDRFRSDESGAVTVDYVVLAAALVGLALSVVNAVNIGSVEGVTHITDAIKQQQQAAGCGASQGGDGVGNCD